MMKEEVLSGLLTAKVIAVIRMKDAARLARTVAALREGGIGAFEVTMTVPGAVDIIRSMARDKAPGTLVGAGTVLDARAAAAVIEAGADFVVSPVTDMAVIQACRERGALVAPGALTPTEILAAWRAGADVVKVFPATSLGPQYFRDIRAPLPEVRLMPTGGVTLENARDFLDAGACCVGIGSALVDKSLVDAEEWGALTSRANRLLGGLNEP